MQAKFDWHRSLRFKLTWPLIAVSVAIAITTTILSFYLGRVWSERELAERMTSARNSLRASSFPLTDTVVESIAGLTGAEVQIYDSGTYRTGTLRLVADEPLKIWASATAQELADFSIVQAQDIAYYCFPVQRDPGGTNRETILLLIEKQRVDQDARSAALLPLIASLLTLLFLVLTALGVVGSIVRRIRRVAERVRDIAAGDFESRVNDTSQDEVGSLAGSVDMMATQLDELWSKVNQSQREKLLYQVASGLAHQLRNTHTGARMALELYTRQVDQTPEEISVALGQLAVAEDYLRRLLLVGQGKQGQDEPATLASCMEAVRAATLPLASHVGRTLEFDLPANLDLWIQDGRSFVGGVTNLVQNAVQAGETVQVVVTLPEFSSPEFSSSEATAQNMLTLAVWDDGPGIDEAIEQKLFDPFVTTKPEGMGLGLPVAKQAAEYLGGTLQWHRVEGRTRFQFHCPCSRTPASTQPARNPTDSGLDMKVGR